MNQKQRQKLFRVPAKKPNVDLKQGDLQPAQGRKFEQAFAASCARVVDILTSAHPLDVLTALNISDLWQLNRASQVKHLLAFSLLVSSPSSSFSSKRISSYEDFATFCEALKAAYPVFPMLEDYVPEPDWGNVKVLLGHQPVAILSGGPIQRITDFMEAFRISHGEGSQAVAELEGAIRLQAELLRRIPRNAEDDRRPRPGYLEVPVRSFWEMAMPALQAPFSAHEMGDRHVAELGQRLTWKREGAFADGLLNGTALPWQAVRIDGVPHPISWRNAATVVLDAWSKTTENAADRVAARLGAFLTKRIKGDTCLPGPLLLRTHGEMAPSPIAAVLTEREHHFLVVPVPPGSWSQAGKAVATMRRLMQDPGWGLQLIETSDGFQLGHAVGAALKPDAVRIILVKTLVSTGLSMTKSPSSDSRLMSLVDACTIFDSIDSVEEFARFWAYVDGLAQMGGGGFSDLGDLYGSFRDAHGQILAGAIKPDYLALDPHWGASWRYEQLKTHWAKAPPNFPDESSAWQTHELESKSGLRRLTAKNTPKLAWCATLAGCTLHFILDVEAVELDPQDGRLLELFVHCAADSIVERAAIIEPYLKLPFDRIRLDCYSAQHLLPSAEAEQAQGAQGLPLITVWKQSSQDDSRSSAARLTVNLVKLSHDLEDAKDARFEAMCAMAVVEKLLEALGRPMPMTLRDALADTAHRQPRFTLTRAQRTVDVPDFTSAQVPTPEDYKVARRHLAFLLKAQGAAPGIYMLEDAKALINPARKAYRDAVHQRIRALDRDSLLRFCIEQYDSMIAAYDRDEWRIKLSLGHEVDFDREQDLAKAHDNFVRESKNYRYLLESAVVLAKPHATPADPDEILAIHAMVDWLFVLYSASDMLHNGIDVGGLEVDDQFVPEVFYSDKRDAQEESFRREQAALRLGVNVAEDDRLGTSLSEQVYLEVLDTAFGKDLSFTYTHLLQVMSTFVLWVSVGGDKELACGYVSDRQTIAQRAAMAHPDLHLDAALAAIEFLILAPDQAWRLIGKEEAADDVPVWEHAKRGTRHTIRPLIALTDGRLLWGAAAVDRTRRIWAGSISSGYLPADYPWPAVRAAVGQLKRELENGLEDRAYEICARAMPFTIKGVDFRDRFPKQCFPDVGDFDVLAYRPDENQWLTVECKYNQPAFSLKDTRRLRDRIFGSGGDRGQIRKIEGRRDFLTRNVDTLRTLLRWPKPADKPFSLIELYVSKDLHFWLRFPPYEVPTQFVQIDTLDAWLRSAKASETTTETHAFDT